MKNELYVGSISARATEEDITRLFTLCGTVTSMHLIRDAVSGEFKGCGYLRMATIAQARDAIETLDGALLVDKVITVSEARPNPQNHKKKTFAGGSRGGKASAARAPKGRKP